MPGRDRALTHPAASCPPPVAVPPLLPLTAGRTGSLTRGMREGPGAAFLRPCPMFAGLWRPQHRHRHLKFKTTVLAKIKQGGKNPGKMFHRERSSGRGGLGATGITRAHGLPHHTCQTAAQWPGGVSSRRTQRDLGRGGARGAIPVEGRLVHGRSARHTGPVRSAGV